MIKARKRFPDWQSRLASYLGERKAKSFQWGDFDCAMFAADWVLLATGDDPASWYRGRYSTARSAAEALSKAGYRTLSMAVSSALGSSIANPLLGQRGDIAMHPNDGNPSLGIIVGSQIAMINMAGGLAFLPLREATHVWKV